MSAETYFNGMFAKERRLTNLGLSAYPSDQEVFEFTLQLAEKVDALYAAARMEPYLDYRGHWQARRIPPEAI